MTDLETGVKSIVCNGTVWFRLQSNRLHWLALLDSVPLQTGGDEERDMPLELLSSYLKQQAPENTGRNMWAKVM